MADAEQLLVGLMSGTSTDGIDAAVVGLTERDPRPAIRLLSFVSEPYERDFRQELLSLASGKGSPADLACLNFALGEHLSEATKAALQQAGVQPAEVLAIGSHGHTVAHLPQPEGRDRPAATLQIGEPAVLAERLGVCVVSDFRVRDMAAGGQGAPLVPYFDYCFLSDESLGRVALNLGGIANLTLLPARGRLEDVIAFDTGPANMPLDLAVLRLFQRPYDEDGAIAASGAVDEALLTAILGHECLARPYPKSCGREQFGDAFVDAVLQRAGPLSPADTLATLTQACGQATGHAIAEVLRGREGPWEIVASGGGVHNQTLLRAIGVSAGTPLILSDGLGIPADAKEVMAFAFLAWETLRGRPSNVPSATGARGPRVLGKITPA
jgi:anhydro-N-acetylmuramic acid kinase